MSWTRDEEIFFVTTYLEKKSFKTVPILMKFINIIIIY